MISKKTKYALRALGYLAERPPGETMLIAELAERGRFPRKFLEAILVALRKGGVLQSRIGKGGGYLLAAPPSEIPVGRVVTILEGEFTPLPCLAEGSPPCGECEDEDACSVRMVMGQVKRTVAELLDGVTVADLLEMSRHARARKNEVLNFSI